MLSFDMMNVTEVGTDCGNHPTVALPFSCLFSHKFMLYLSNFQSIVTKSSSFHPDGALICFVMRSFFVLFLWAIITFVSSSQYLDESSAFDDPFFMPGTGSFDDPSSLPEPNLLENESTPSIFMPYDDRNLAMDTTLPLPADNNLFDGEDLSGLDEFHLADDGISMSESAPSDISLDWEANCGDPFQHSGKRRAKRGASCKNSPETSTEKTPDGTGPPPPSPGGPSFFPGYGKYTLDKKTNILRIPGFTPSFSGENDVCLIYTEGYLPYGVCGTELFNSVQSFWGISTYTLTKAVLGMLPTLRAPVN